jgi:predicted 2-oxoglutarate/Fe(II)-dependent dioxygenase YbiX
MELYREKHPLFNIDIDTGYQLLRYQEGQFYVQHTDSFKAEQRSVSCSIQLNEDYEGGEFAFFNREIMMRTGVGSVIMFPSNFMYPHEVMPVQKGTRYSIITWLV